MTTLDKTLAPPHEHASDAALEGLFVEIFDGLLAPGESLPAERLLAERYEVSRVTVRQAVHKLKDLGLVEVRQGGASKVQDPAKADARVLELLLRYADKLQSDTTRKLLQDLAEYQELYATGLLEAAARHASEQERERLLSLVESYPGDLDQQQAEELNERFWKAITAAGKNRILQMEMALWQRWSDKAQRLDDEPQAVRWFYLTLARQLLSGQDPLPYYLASVRTPRG